MLSGRRSECQRRCPKGGQKRKGRWQVDQHAPDRCHDASELLLIWLLQQAPICGVDRCPDRRFRRRYANFKPTSPVKRPASSTWRHVAGPMVSSARDADVGEPTNG